MGLEIIGTPGLCFLMLIGVMLVADGMGQHIGKAYEIIPRTGSSGSQQAK